MLLALFEILKASRPAAHNKGMYSLTSTQALKLKGNSTAHLLSNKNESLSSEALSALRD